MLVMERDEYHLKIPLGMKCVDDFVIEYEANTYLQDYYCVQ